VLAREASDVELPKFGESHSCGHPTQARREVTRKGIGIAGASKRSGYAIQRVVGDLRCIQSWRCFASAGDGQPAYLVDQCSCTTILGSSYAGSRRKHTTSNYPNRDLSLYRNLQLFACTPGVSPSLSICRECDFSWSSRFFTGDCVRSPFWQAARSAGAERAAKPSSLPAPSAQGGQRFGDYRGRIIPVRLGLHLEIRVNGWPEVRSHDSQCSSLFRRQHRHLRIDTLIVSGPLTAYR
jgi:hypothetical protein